MKYKHIFFDLDRTLWDFETNSTAMLEELICRYGLDKKGVDPLPEFIYAYHKINQELWEDYHKGLVDKAALRVRRFEESLALFGIGDKELSRKISEDYVRESPLKTALLPFARESLDYLKSRYCIHIITNGFEETQHIKIGSAGLDVYFTEVITSERSGFKKPDGRMYEYSLKAAGARREESIMIGDHFELDVMGAKMAGLDQCYFNPSRQPCREKPTHEISALSELIGIL